MTNGVESMRNYNSKFKDRYLKIVRELFLLRQRGCEQFIVKSTNIKYENMKCELKATKIL